MHERDVWEQKADAQMRSAVSTAEQAVKINGISKGDIDAELQYQAQQVCPDRLQQLQPDDHLPTIVNDNMHDSKISSTAHA